MTAFPARERAAFFIGCLLMYSPPLPPERIGRQTKAHPKNSTLRAKKYLIIWNK